MLDAFAASRPAGATRAVRVAPAMAIDPMARVSAARAPGRGLELLAAAARPVLACVAELEHHRVRRSWTWLAVAVVAGPEAEQPEEERHDREPAEEAAERAHAAEDAAADGGAHRAEDRETEEERDCFEEVHLDPR